MLGHVPVLLDEVLQWLNPLPDRDFIDATLGGGGHAAAILERTSPAGRLLAIDQDQSAIENARLRLEAFGPRLVTVNSNFRDIAAVAEQEHFHEVDGILADVGLSSMMVDDAERGFSFMREGPLDMRMNRAQELTAADVVNTFGEKELANIIFNFGEERRSRAIASSIVRSRPLTLTTDLVRAVERVAGGQRYGQINPSTRTFQGLRIFVNDELGSLESFLDAAMTVVRPGGRLAVICFHSLEDRIVKNKFRSSVVAGKALTKKVIIASDEERRRNSRARSAKLRVWERGA